MQNVLAASGRSRGLILWSVLALGLIIRLIGIDHDIDGHHQFRQAHVISNIDLLILNGYSLVTDAWARNIPIKIFDFPLYQNLVALLANLSLMKVSPLLLGRLVNVGLFVFNCALFYWILRRLDFSAAVGALTLFFYSTSPLAAFYDRAIVPDNLATTLSFLSLAGFLQWQKEEDMRAYLVMLICGVLAALIKNPVYLPVCLFIGLWFTLQNSLRAILAPKMLFFMAFIGLAIVTFKLYGNFINYASLSTPQGEYSWYFGNLEQRTNVGIYQKIIKRVAVEFGSPLVFLAFVYGIYSLFTPPSLSNEQKVFAYGLLFGALITILIFLNLHYVHNYYQIPFVFIYSTVAAIGAERIIRKIDWSVRFRSKATVAVVLVLLTIIYSFAISRDEPAQLIAQGKAIQEHTKVGDFVFFVVEKPTQDPKYLYFAQRHGYNLAVQDADFGKQDFAELYGKDVGDADHAYVFVPLAFAADVVVDQRLQLHRETAEGKLYRYTF
jgi:hypothetical protein